MAAITTAAALPEHMEDVLAHLPVSGITEYGKGQLIYGPGSLSENIYLVVSGKVCISQIAEHGGEVLLEIVRPEELFGESAFIAVSRRSERATALEDVTLMTWAVSDMEELVVQRPRLAVALLQTLAQRNAEFTRRIESFACDSIERRLARSLLRFSERLGAVEEDGAVRMMPFTHALLSQYVGTSREIITHYMNRFRKQGHMSYSRQGILLHRDSFQTLLGRNAYGAADTGS
jgi:CRP/FNR family transcriptional regulator, cyclic AMP receptor protein